jgi:CHAT domain-containing protein
MTEKIRILFLSSNPWSTGRILVDEEAREVFERINEGPYRDSFELHVHTAIRPQDLQRLLLMYQPQIVHFSGHGSKQKKIILGGTRGGATMLDRQGLTNLLALYRSHLRLVLLNACFTHKQARSIAGVVNYSIGASNAIGDKVGVTFAGAFYRALGFGRSVRDAFESAMAELALTKKTRSRGMQLFVKKGLSERDPFPLDGQKTVRVKRAFASSV